MTVTPFLPSRHLDQIPGRPKPQKERRKRRWLPRILFIDLVDLWERLSERLDRRAA